MTIEATSIEEARRLSQINQNHGQTSIDVQPASGYHVFPRSFEFQDKQIDPFGTPANDPKDW